MNKTTIQFFIGITILLLASFIGWQEVKKQGANWLPVKYVRVEGTFQYISKKRVKQVLKGQVNKGLYNADIQNIQKSVALLPWVENVMVKRVWPDAIDIKIIEQIPVARWDSTDLVNKNGELFRPDNIDEFNQLPLISGNTGNERKLLEIMKGLSIALSDQELKLKEFRVSDRRAWTIKLEDGMELKLGRNQPLKKLQRFLKTLPLIGEEQIAKITVVDLRYPNGYALTWKLDEEQIDWKLIADKNRDITY